MPAAKERKKRIQKTVLHQMADGKRESVFALKISFNNLILLIKYRHPDAGMAATIMCCAEKKTSMYNYRMGQFEVL
ncbi:hypothetical protein LJC47_07985 [Desulfosarcina sp. OttesenSCG-928-B08]|nr:hypothetical protein [Desulfosarcina sp. OttesenSCG-928-B08]